jgi:NAD(P)-dependent dehydrogenase (short-subunit alcohol dehydrogenase family)
MEEQVLRGTALIAAAKAALFAYVRHLARELGPHGHRVNIVRFGAARTRALSATIGTENVRGFTDLVAAAHPNGRLVTVEEVAELVWFLSGEAGNWFNGANLDFTGGEVQGLYDALAWPDSTPPLPVPEMEHGLESLQADPIHPTRHDGDDG